MSEDQALAGHLKLMMPAHGFSGWSGAFRSDTSNAVGTGPEEAGLGLRGRSIKLFKALGVPSDPRGIVLACGFLAAGAIGVGALLPPGDLIGLAYIAAAVVG